MSCIGDSDSNKQQSWCKVAAASHTHGKSPPVILAVPSRLQYDWRRWRGDGGSGDYFVDNGEPAFWLCSLFSSVLTTTYKTKGFMRRSDGTHSSANCTWATWRISSWSKWQGRNSVAPISRFVTSLATVKSKSKSKSTILKSKSKSTLSQQVQVRVRVLFKEGKSKSKSTDRKSKSESKSSRKKTIMQAVVSHSSSISLAVIVW